MINAACAGVVILALVLFGTAVAASRPVVEGWSPILDDLFPAVAGACAVLAVAAVAALRRGAPGRRRHCAMILLALLAISFSSVGAVVLANQYLDAGSSREYEARPATGALTLVPSRFFAPPAGSYYLTLELQRPGAGQLEVLVAEAISGRAAPGQRWFVRTRAGGLGYEWAESARRGTGYDDWLE